jgi:tRNA threonylcarbamoyl adenosine modification protein (Sua5/YciO/YrdC/YwlC family)
MGKTVFFQGILLLFFKKDNSCILRSLKKNDIMKRTFFYNMNIIPFAEEFFPNFSSFLNEEKVVILPTETSYGFSCNAFSTEGLQFVQLLKKRTQKPFIILFPDFIEAEKFVFLPPLFSEYFLRSKNEPISFLVKKKSIFPETFFPQESHVAIRVPASFLLRKFLKQHGVPIISTSTNRTGEPPLFDPKEIVEIFGKEENLLLATGGVLPKRNPSMLIEQKDEKIFRIR